MEALKTAAIAICCTLLSGIAWTACAEVRMEPQNSSAHPRVAITLQGRSVKGAEVSYYAHDSTQVLFEAISDDSGVVVLPKLWPGDYDIVAALDAEVRNSLWLRVVRKGGTKTLSIDLTGAYEAAHPELRVGTLAPVEGPVRDRIQVFEGTVLAPDASSPGTKIVVIKMGVPARDFILSLRTDPNGHFEAQLPGGRYVGFFFANGFRTAKVPFEITQGWLRISTHPSGAWRVLDSQALKGRAFRRAARSQKRNGL